MRRAQALVQLAIEAGLFAADDEADVLAQYRDAIKDVPNLTFLDWLFIFNILGPDDVQTLSERFDRTVFLCDDCQHVAFGSDLDPEDEDLHCPACGSERTVPTDDPSHIDAASVQEMRALEEEQAAQPTADADGADGPSYADFEQGLRAGTKLGRCVIESYVARGGMGVVYRAKDLDRNEVVAVKVLLSAFTSNKTLALRFREEARAVAQLRHPNIVQVFEYGEKSGHAYFSMEWVEGESLAQRMKRQGQVDVGEMIDIAAQVCSALQSAHGNSIIHRDVKPDNILIMKDGGVKLADFGLSKNQQSDLQLSQSGTYVGTPAYLAPEQLGHRVTPKADLYALACTMYHALTGRLPFTGDDAAEVLQQHLTSPFPSARTLNPAVSAGLDRLLQWMASKNPKNRPADAAEVEDKLLQLREALGSGPMRQSTARGGNRASGSDVGSPRPRTSGIVPPKPPTSIVNRPKVHRAAAPPPTDRQPPDAVPATAAGGPSGAIDDLNELSAEELMSDVGPMTPLTSDISADDGAIRSGNGRRTTPPAPPSPPPGKLLGSEPKAPANFPYRETRKAQHQNRGSRLRLEDGLLSPRRESVRTARTTPGKSRGKSVSSAADDVLDDDLPEADLGDWNASRKPGRPAPTAGGKKKSTRSLPIAIAVVAGVFLLVGVLLLVSLVSGTDPYETAKALIRRGHSTNLTGRQTGNLTPLLDLETDLEKFRTEFPQIQPGEFDDLRRQLDFTYVMKAPDGRFDTPLKRLQAWVAETTTTTDASRKLAVIDAAVGTDAAARPRIDVLRQPLVAMIERQRQHEELNLLMARSRTVATADAARGMIEQLQDFSKKHPTAIDDNFKAELARLIRLVGEADANSRIAQMRGVTGSKEAEAMWRDMADWMQHQQHTLGDAVRQAFDTELKRLRELATVENELRDLLARAQSADSTADAQAVLQAIDNFEQRYPNMRERLTAAREQLRQRIGGSGEVQEIAPGDLVGPFDLTSTRTFSITIPSLCYAGFQVSYPIADHEITLLLMAADDDDLLRVVDTGHRQDDDLNQARHTYLVRTLGPGRYVFIIQPAGERAIRNVTVRVTLIPCDDVTATPTGAVPIRIGASDGPHRVTESRWYSFSVSEPMWIDLSATFKHDDGDADLALYRDTGGRQPGVRLGVSQTITDTERIVQWLEPGDYLARIYYQYFLDLFKNRQKGGSPVRFALQRARPEISQPTAPRQLDRNFDGGPLEAGEWMLPPGDYDIRREIEIRAGAVLVLRGGTRLSFRAGVGIMCHGKIISQGDAGRWVEFTAVNRDAGWTGVVVTGPDAHANFRRTSFEYAIGRRYMYTTRGSVFTQPDNGTKGGGLFFLRTSHLHLVDDCLFRNCSAKRVEDHGGFGGAMCIEAATVELRGCAFRNNRSDMYGGAVYTDGRVTVRLDRCRFEENRASDGGAIMWSTNTNGYMRDCVFSDNTVADDGGALYFNESNIIRIENCVFSGNSARLGGAIVGTNIAMITVARTNFTGNRASSSGGGVTFVAVVGSFSDCQFSGNDATTSGGALVFERSAIALVGNTFENNRAPRGADISASYRRALPAEYQLTPGQLRAQNTFRNDRANSLDVSPLD